MNLYGLYYFILLLQLAMQNVTVCVSIIIIFVVCVLECPNGHPYVIGNVSVYVTKFIRKLFIHFYAYYYVLFESSYNRYSFVSSVHVCYQCTSLHGLFLTHLSQ